LRFAWGWARGKGAPRLERFRLHPVEALVREVPSGRPAVALAFDVPEEGVVVLSFGAGAYSDAQVEALVNKDAYSDVYPSLQLNATVVVTDLLTGCSASCFELTEYCDGESLYGEVSPNPLSPAPLSIQSSITVAFRRGADGAVDVVLVSMEMAVLWTTNGIYYDVSSEEEIAMALRLLFH
jgi:hypothetical protein